MKKLFSILLAIVMAFTSAGMVFADDAPPPVDDQSLPPTTKIYPTGAIFEATTLFFNWAAVDGADKYKVEVQKLNMAKRTWAAYKTLTVGSKSPIPPTTATITSKKPFAEGIIRWRVTAINTDVGFDAGGTGQTSDWWGFAVNPMTITDMYPGTYSGRIDPKKGDGVNVNNPVLNWDVEYGGSAHGNLIGSADRIKFVVTVTQGATRYTNTVPAGTYCDNATFGLPGAVCSVPLSVATNGGLTALTPGIPYKWEVYGIGKPNIAAFTSDEQIIATAQDVMEYNPYAPLTSPIVTDAVFTNKPTFSWPNVTLPAKGAYQLVFQKADLKKTTKAWASAGVVTIVPGKTKNPVSKALVCPASGGDCYYTFAAPFKVGYEYRWNVRIISGALYGPWANPGTVGIGGPSVADDMVQWGADGDCFQHACSSPDTNYYNSFYGLNTPPKSEVVVPSYNGLTKETKPEISWGCPVTPVAYTEGMVYDESSKTFTSTHGNIAIPFYRVDLKRVSPNPLTKTLSLVADRCGLTSGPGGSLETALEAAVPLTYTTNGLPRGTYEVVVSPLLKGQYGQASFFPPASIQSEKSRFVIGPEAPSLTTGSGAVLYDAGTQKMSVQFDTPVEAAKMKFRVLVAMEDNTQWRWVKIGTFSGSACTVTGSYCRFEFPVYKPGTKKDALATGTYRVYLQAAKMDEGNGNAAKDKKFGPFGPLSPTPWSGTLPTTTL